MPVTSVPCNKYATLLENGDVLMKTPISDEAYLVTDRQIQRILEFDAMLRNCKDQRFDIVHEPVPMGYFTFANQFNADDDSPYGVTKLHDDGTFHVVKKSIPPSTLIAALLEAESQLEAVALAKKEHDLLTKLMLDAAERESRRNERARAGFVERKEKRGRKAVHASRLDAMKALAKAAAPSDEDGRPSKRVREESYTRGSSVEVVGTPIVLPGVLADMFRGPGGSVIAEDTDMGDVEGALGALAAFEAAAAATGVPADEGSG